MRPIPGDDPFGRPRAVDNESPGALLVPPAPQMTYVLATESMVDVSLHQTSTHSSPSREIRKSNEPEAAEARLTSSSNNADKDGREGRPSSSKGQVDTVKHGDMHASRPESPGYRTPAMTNPSQPMTPIMLGASGPASALSSGSSRRNSLTESFSMDLGSQLLSIDSEANKDPDSSMMNSGSAPQLIMPSIKMPSRRPFTEAGKAMGRLKVLIAGDSGVGKTSLIKAIVQSCEHIVHVDPIAPSPVSLVAKPTSPRRAGRRQSSRSELRTTQITEIYASTKPYPEWWADLDDSRILRRRKSLGDTILDRNICFVDTPGFGGGSSAMDSISPVVQYVESHLQRLSSNTLADGDTLNLIGGDGGVQVDIVFYMFSKELKPADVYFLRQLSSLTNVIPLLAKADLSSPEQIAASKAQAQSQLEEVDIKPFSFTTAFSTQIARGLGPSPHAISSAVGSDHDTMDASLLMSPDYVQPLMPTELSALVEHVFSQDGASWLRHSAASKYLQWRKAGDRFRQMAIYQQPSLDNHSRVAPTSQVLLPPNGVASSFALARLADHTRREERLAQIRLANWAAELQKSLDNERARYEALARNQRAIWLTERLNECVHDGTLAPVARARPNSSQEILRKKLKRKFGGPALDAETLQIQDPLGLLEVADDMRRKGIIALELLGSLSVLGGLALWFSRQYGNLQAYGWAMSEWDKFWYGR